MRLEEYNLPDDWEWGKIGDFAKLIRGVSYKKDDASKDPENGYLPILRANNINNNIIFDDLVYVPSEKIKKEQIIRSGDILISMSSGSKHLVGKTAQADEDYKASFGAFCGLIRINDKINKKFINFFFKSQNYRRIISHLSKGININNLRREYIESMPIPLPPFKTQNKIVEIMEKAEKLKEYRAEADELTDEYLKSVFLEMFGDPIKNPKGWKTFDGKKYSKKISVGVVIRPASYYVDEGVIALRSLNIKPNKIKLEDLVYFSPEDNKDKLSKSILRKGDVVIVRTGVTGTAAVVPEKLDGCNCIDLIVVRPNSEIVHPIYLSCFFNSENGKNLVLSKEVGGIQKHFNVGAIKNLEIPIPPIALQNQFAQIVQQVETLKSYQAESKQEIDNLFNILIQKAFKGELVC